MRLLAMALLLVCAAAAPALAHAPAPQAGESPGARWILDPWVVLPLILTGVVYALGACRLARRSGAAGRGPLRGAVLFVSGWIVLALALVSPVDSLGEQLFSVHMVQHEMLMLGAAPLLVLAAPGAAFMWFLPAVARRAVASGSSALRRLWHGLVKPLPGWTLHAAVLWVWHMPVLFQAALEHDTVHWLQHLSFLLAGIVFWRSLVLRASGQGVAILSLFTTAAHSSLLGALLTFSPTVWYGGYLDTAAPWGVSPLEDQQLGGLIMWMPAGAVYLLAALWLLARWMERSQREARRQEAANTTAARLSGSSNPT